MHMIKARKEFPVLRKSIYANTAVFGPFYDSLLDWRQEHDLDFLLGASDMRGESLALIAETRTTLAQFFDCNEENVALISNMSSGLNMFLDGVDKNTKVLTLTNDYPSVEWPFLSRGFSTEYISVDENLEEAIKNVLSEKSIDILALSIVQWQNGIKIDLDFLKQLKKDYPDLLIIADGTQYCGIENFSFNNSGIDVLVASTYKWLLAGYGSGFMFFKDHVAEKTKVNTIGFNSAEGDIAARATIRFAKRFEPGHLSSTSFGSLKFSLDFFTAIGKNTIDAQNKKLSQKAKKEFTKLGLLEDSVASRKEHSTIFNIKGGDTLFQHLLDNNVICTQRGDGIRLSFHFYNTEEEIDMIVKIIKTKRIAFAYF